MTHFKRLKELLGQPLTLFALGLVPLATIAVTCSLPLDQVEAMVQCGWMAYRELPTVGPLGYTGHRQSWMPALLAGCVAATTYLLWSLICAIGWLPATAPIATLSGVIPLGDTIVRTAFVLGVGVSLRSFSANVHTQLWIYAIIRLVAESILRH